MSPSRTERPPRQGVILLVVVIMLTLFLVVGLSFVLYAESEATASRIYREVPTDKADIPPEQLLAWARAVDLSRARRRDRGRLGTARPRVVADDVRLELHADVECARQRQPRTESGTNE